MRSTAPIKEPIVLQGRQVKTELQLSVESAVTDMTHYTTET